MKIRKRSLPEGWYPGDPLEVDAMIKGWKLQENMDGRGISAVVPHAGWYYSGRLAAAVINQMDRELDTVIVAGGHLPPDSPLYMAQEEGFAVPSGILKTDLRLKNWIEDRFSVTADIYRDNTVEIQLPLVSSHWKDPKIVWMRVPPDNTAIELAASILAYTEKYGSRIAVIGSTDLTHYGSSYGFTPAGSGLEALKWVKEVNDARIIASMLKLDTEAVLKQGNENKAACSSGAAAFASAWAALNSIKRGRLIGYYSSYDVTPAEAFVGYGGILYEK